MLTKYLICNINVCWNPIKSMVSSLLNIVSIYYFLHGRVDPWHLLSCLASYLLLWYLWASEFISQCSCLSLQGKIPGKSPSWYSVGRPEQQPKPFPGMNQVETLRTQAGFLLFDPLSLYLEPFFKSNFNYSQGSQSLAA